MSHDDLSAEHREYSDDVAAYALGALAPEETEAFERHLETCVVCRNELISFEQVVAAMPASAPRLRAPEGLRDRVMAEVEDQSSSKLGAQAGGWRRRGRSRSRDWGGGLARPVLAFGATLAIVAVAVFAVIQISGSSSSTATRLIPAHVVGVGTAEVRVSGGHAQLVIHGMAAPPAGKIYEVWLAPAHGAPAPTSALFDVTTHGDADVGIPGNLHGVAQVLVTPEPRGGSQAPTHTPVISATVS